MWKLGRNWGQRHISSNPAMAVLMHDLLRLYTVGEAFLFQRPQQPVIWNAAGGMKAAGDHIRNRFLKGKIFRPSRIHLLFQYNTSIGTPILFFHPEKAPRIPPHGVTEFC
jgi:hypothetical protein